MRITIIIRPFWEDTPIKFPEYEIVFEGQPEEILAPFNETLDKIGAQPIQYKEGYAAPKTTD